MTIELSNLTFTEQDDIIPASGEEIIVNTGIANTLAGNDSITGDTTNSISGETNGIYNSGTLNTDDGKDIITGISTTVPTDSSPPNGWGIHNETGIIETGKGNDIIIGIGRRGGIISTDGTIDTGDDNDTITGRSTTGIVGRRSGGIILSNSTLNTGKGNDVIIGTLENLTGWGIYNNQSIFNTGDGNDIIIGDSTLSTNSGVGISNTGSMDTGNGNDIINGLSETTVGIGNSGLINTGDGADSIIGRAGFFNGVGITNTDIINTGNDDDTITGIGFIGIQNLGIINTGNGEDSIIADGGFDGTGSVFLENGKDYLKGFGSGNFNGGNGQDILELTSGSYTVGISGTAVNFTKGSIVMNTSDFEKLQAGNTTYNFSSLTNGQTIFVA